jgi:hypothetical protein
MDHLFGTTPLPEPLRTLTDAQVRRWRDTLAGATPYDRALLEQELRRVLPPDDTNNTNQFGTRLNQHDTQALHAIVTRYDATTSQVLRDAFRYALSQHLFAQRYGLRPTDAEEDR